MEPLTQCPIPICSHDFLPLQPPSLLPPRFCPQCRLPLPGATLQGRYEIREYLGTGGFGITYTALDRTTGQEHVLKILYNRDSKAVELFQREAALLQRDLHQGLPEYIADFEVYGYPCLVMEKIAGQSLLEELEEQGRPFTEAELVPLMIQLVAILQALHEAEIIHRDIKPDNIWYGCRQSSGDTTVIDEIMLIDMFCAREMDAHYFAQMGKGQAVTQIATPGYTPLEQMQGKPVPQSDLYAVGVTMIHLLTGRHPLDLYDAHEQNFRWHDTLSAPVSADLIQIIHRLTAMKPRDRLLSAAELKDHLEQLRDGFSAQDEKTRIRTKIIPKVGERFRDGPDCPEMIVVPAGEFLMGSPSHEKGRSDSEGPQHRVTIAQPFAVGVYPVTFAEWDACAATGDCNGYRPSDQGWGRGRRPVINMRWEHAQAYGRWLSEQTGKAYRLLSEAEWEYVARAGTQGMYSFGDAENQLERYAWYEKNSGYGTHPVGGKRPNRFGLYDMHGNVEEWVQDCWHTDYRGAPTDGSAWVSGDISLRVLRGGPWYFSPRNLRSAVRGYGNAPDDHVESVLGDDGIMLYPNEKRNSIGFRVARSLP